MTFEEAKRTLENISSLTEEGDKSLHYYQCEGQFVFNVRNMNKFELEMALMHIWMKANKIKDLPDDIFDISLN